MTTSAQREQRPLLLIAHPGHELRLFGWLRQARPLIAILTDGSGSTGISRMDLSEDLIARTGGDIVMAGRFAEPELYDIILRKDPAPLADVVNEIARLIDSADARIIVSDAGEGYHPGHDLCSPLLAQALQRSARRASVRHVEYRVIGDPRQSCAHSSILTLDDKTLREKIAASRSYAAASGDVLSREVQYMFDTYGEESFRYEGFFRAGSEPPQLHNGLRYYELRGEERVREGRYQEVLRHESHLAPLAAALKLSVH